MRADQAQIMGTVTWRQLVELTYAMSQTLPAKFISDHDVARLRHAAETAERTLSEARSKELQKGPTNAKTN